MPSFLLDWTSAIACLRDFLTKPSKSYRLSRTLRSISWPDPLSMNTSPPIRHRLHWLPVTFGVKYKVLLVVYKAVHNETPDYISDLLKLRRTREGLRSSSEVQLAEPVVRLKGYGRRTSGFVGPTLWNALPCAVREASSVGPFKQKLKASLFSLVYTALWLSHGSTISKLNCAFEWLCQRRRCIIL